MMRSKVDRKLDIYRIKNIPKDYFMVIIKEKTTF